MHHKRPRAEPGSDGNVDVIVSPTWLKPEWSDLTKLKYNPDFNLGMMDYFETAIANQELS